MTPASPARQMVVFVLAGLYVLVLLVWAVPKVVRLFRRPRW